jgi:hypothetical protein
MPNYQCVNCGKPFKNRKYPPPRCDKAGCGGRVELVQQVRPPGPVAPLVPTEHKGKHRKLPKNTTPRDLRKGTTGGAAKYDTRISSRAIETGALGALGNRPGIVETGQTIGWANGKDCTKVEIYVSSDDTYHGRPVDDDTANLRGGRTATINTW